MNGINIWNPSSEEAEAGPLRLSDQSSSQNCRAPDLRERPHLRNEGGLHFTFDEQYLRFTAGLHIHRYTLA